MGFYYYFSKFWRKTIALSIVIPENFPMDSLMPASSVYSMLYLLSILLKPLTICRALGRVREHHLSPAYWVFPELKTILMCPISQLWQHIMGDALLECKARTFENQPPHKLQEHWGSLPFSHCVFLASLSRIRWLWIHWFKLMFSIIFTNLCQNYALLF